MKHCRLTVVNSGPERVNPFRGSTEICMAAHLAVATARRPQEAPPRSPTSVRRLAIAVTSAPPSPSCQLLPARAQRERSAGATKV